MFTCRRFSTVALLFAVFSAACPIMAAEQSAAIAPGTLPAAILARAARLGPTSRQMVWQRQELTAFIHFGPNTYTDREIGRGTENVNIVNPAALDTDQWIRTFKDAGFTKVMLVTKHHDGLVLWPTRYSRFSVRHSTWRNGKGDIVGDFVRSAHKYGIAVGLYLSPADLHEALPGGTYADGSRPKAVTIPTLVAGDTRKPAHTFRVVADDYNHYYMNQLYELLTQYGPIEEFFFDGFNPLKNRKQPYDFVDWYKLVRTLQPGAVMFGGPDVNWVGNEDGVARQAQWSVMPFVGEPRPDQLTHVEDPTSATVGNDASIADRKTRLLSWYPAECDARLEAGWFWHPKAAPKTLAALQSMYYTSVGRNCHLLLDVPPDRSGRFDAADVAALHRFGVWIRMSFTHDLAAGAAATRTPDGGAIVTLAKPVRFQTIGLAEHITTGQRVASFAVDIDAGDGGWKTIARGQTIGYKRLLALPQAYTARRVRVVVLHARAKPEPIDVRLYR